MWKDDEEFSKAHPLNSKIRDNNIFLHATSLKRFLAIQQTGFLLKNPPQKNFSISQVGVCFEKYEEGKYCGGDAKGIIDHTMNGYCDTSCRQDQSSEGVILQTTGKDLLKLGCPIYVDWNKHIPKLKNKDGRPVNVDYNSHVLSIVVDGDVPLDCLTIMKKVPFKALASEAIENGKEKSNISSPTNSARMKTMSHSEDEKKLSSERVRIAKIFKKHIEDAILELGHGYEVDLQGRFDTTPIRIEVEVKAQEGKIP